MRQAVFLLLCASVFAATTFVSRLYAEDGPAKPLAKLELQDGDSIVFLGDSITHQRLYTQYVEDYFYTRMPHLRLKLHNAGVGGARAWDALERFDQDVAAYKPKYVTILLGMNDGTYQPFNQGIFDTYQQDMTTLLDKLQGIGAVAIPMTPTMYDSRAERAKQNSKRAADAVALYNSVLAYYGTWLREVSVERGLGFVDMWGPLNTITLEQRKTEPAFTLIKDAVHPGPDGQVVMATAIINDLGLPRQVSNINITLPASSDANPQARASGGKVSDLTVTDDGITFTFAAEALPWVLPEEARLGGKLTRMGHRLGKESLEIHGLPAGQYALVIDGAEAGRYASAALERHVELQENEKTPQFQQALQVANLNKQRNEGPIGKLRGEWSRFQQFARTRKAAAEQPDNEQVQKQLATLTEQVNGIEERVAAHNAEAKALEDQIFEINRPVARRYELKRVEAPAAARRRKPAAATAN
ncbi:MAG: SGNH/GDSL hydrolase family protein [Planctomycetaceae bacterium]|nr:SGNH/GDSL hydrolase family protein [Planctomycetaceae bacterium]